MFNQYTPAGTTPVPGAPTGEAETTNFQPVISYFNLVQSEISQVQSGAEVFIGETGYSTYWNTAAGGPGAGSQANVYQQIFAWLNTEYASGHMTVPLFAFQAFNVPSGDPVKANYGIYDPVTGLKIALPSWTSQPLATQFGTTGHDLLAGGAGNDTFHGGNGNDSIDGGSGQNTSIHAGASASYAIKAAVGAATLVVQDKTGTDGTDQLANIQNVQFADKTIVASWITKAASLPAAQIMKVVDLYTAGLGRAPDALGLDYWASRLADGAKIADISKAIFSSAEAAPIYSQTNSDPVFVNLVYQMALGHVADAAGQTYWVNALNSGALARTDLVTALIAGAQGADKQYIANKEAVGAHFALTAGLNNAAWGRMVEVAVNGTPASVTAANAQTDAFATMAATPATSELVVQIVGLVP